MRGNVRHVWTSLCSFTLYRPSPTVRGQDLVIESYASLQIQVRLKVCQSIERATSKRKPPLSKNARTNVVFKW